MTNSRMPEEAEKVPVWGSDDYMKLEDGKNRFRVLSAPIVWYETWIEEDGKKKPMRSKTKLEKEPENISIGKYWTQFNKYFWSFIVWNYEKEAIQLLNIDKKWLLMDLENYLWTEKKADPRDYDITVVKKGEGTDTKYTLLVDDNEPVAKEITKEWKKIEAYVDMNIHLDGWFVLKEAREQAEAADQKEPF